MNVTTETLDSCGFNTTNVSEICDNRTNQTIVFPLETRPETYFVPVIFFVIFVVGVLGNGTLVMIFVRHKHMRNVPNTYIFSLALADLLVVVTSVPFTSIIYTMESWPWGTLVCKISETTKDLSVAVSVFTLTALSADRFFAIVDPLKKFHATGGTRSAKRITIGTTVIVWILSLLIALPASVGSHIKQIPDEENPIFSVCYPFPSEWMNDNYAKMMVLLKFFILYLIPLIIIATFYLGMAVSLITSTKNMPGEIQGIEKQIKARKKVAVTVLIFVAVFAVCFAPIHIFMLFFYLHPDFQSLYNDFWHYFRITGFCLAYMNYCVNPVALYFVSGAFRKYFNQYLFCKKPTRSRRSTYPHQHTSISLLSVKRNQVSITRNDKQASINRSPDALTMQETTIALLDNGNSSERSHSCNKIR
ncbi:neuropeptide CCHamide-1 receptor-like [Diabrotica undecimpunctata]|uniref:neuropeptide CCHamide-1 receptor-like n=1 Tax=Diabrotica undecimpunctata TaxID=50387 RepID=UPI003B641041